MNNSLSPSLQKLRYRYRLERIKAQPALDIAPLHASQQIIYDDAARFKVLPCGRRFGKTDLAAYMLAHSSMAGESWGYFTPVASQSYEVWRKLLTILNRVISYKNETMRRLETKAGGKVQMWSMERPANVRSHKFHGVIFDEASLIPHLKLIFEQDIRPTLTDYRGKAFFFGTPKGLNDFYTLYMNGVNRLTDWSAYTYPTSANPFIDAHEIEQVRLSLPERTFQQEYLAQFVEDGSLFRGVADVSTLTRREPYRGRFAFGIDFAQTEDYTVVSVLDMETKQQVYVDRYNKASWQLQRNRIKALYDVWQPEVCFAESNSIGSVNIEALQQDGLYITPFVTTAASKREIIDALALAIEQRTVSLLNDPVQIAELSAFQMERTPSGNFKYQAPAGMHDDMVMALAIAWHGVNYGRLVMPVFLSWK